MYTHARTHAHRHEGNIIFGVGGREHPGVPALTSEKTKRRTGAGEEGCQPLLQFCSARRGGWAAFLPAWEEEVGNSYLRNRPRWEGTEEGTRCPVSLQGQKPAECGLGLKEQWGEDFSRMNRLMSPGASPSNSFPWGGKLLQGKDVRGGWGPSCKVLECQEPENPGGGRLKPLFSLTISLQLVGKLKEEVLVVDDLELAHVGLGL